MEGHASPIILLLAAMFAYFAAICAINIILQAICGGGRRSTPLALTPEGESWPLISIIVPAFNEERVIEATLRSILDAAYSPLEIIVVDDGSTDLTRQIVAHAAAGDPRIRLVAQPRNMGKAGALNAGIARAEADYIVVVDADTVVSSEFLARIVAPILAGQADAVAGNVKVGNRGSLLARLQSIEYITELNSRRLLQDISGHITTIPGAAGAMRKSAVQVGGAYSARTRAEDSDLTLRLVETGFVVAYQPLAIVRTEVPSSWKALFYQRRRWIYGNLQCIGAHFRTMPYTRPSTVFGMPIFVYENLIKPPLQFSFLVLSGLGLAQTSGATILFFHLTLIVMNAIAGILAYRADRESLRELACLPLHYFIWPVFRVFAYGAALWYLVRRNAISWRKPPRSGEFARATITERHSGAE